MFPTEEFETDTYWDNGADLMPYFLLLAFIYPCTQVTAFLVVEKSTKMREGLKMMGASTSAFWVSWFIWFFFEYTIIACLCLFMATVGGVFAWSDPGVLFIWIWIYCLSTASFGFAVSSLSLSLSLP